MSRRRASNGEEPLPRSVHRKVNKDGSIVYVARWYDSGRVRHAATFDTVVDAENHLSAMRSERRKGGTADPTGGHTRLSVWWGTWRETWRERPSTVANRVSLARNHLLPYFGNWRLCDIRPSSVTAYIAYLESKNLATASVRKNVQLLSKCLQAAVRDELISSNPARKVDVPTVHRVEAVFLTPDQVLRLEQEIDPWWKLTVPFQADAGLRIGELSALRVCDLTVDIAKGDSVIKVPVHMAAGQDIVGATTRVRQTAVYVSREITKSADRRGLNDTKTYSGLRTVPTITKSVAERVVDMVAERHLAPEALLFTGKRGGPLAPSTWRSRVWNTAVEAAGLDELGPTPHSMRHTAVSLWIQSGVTDPLKIARWAGHASVKTVYDIYGHLLPEDDDGVREALEATRSGSTATERSSTVAVDFTARDSRPRAAAGER